MKEKTIFFSYVRTDSDFVKRLAGDLRKNGIKIWLDQFDIKPGSHWDQSIEKALMASERVMVVLSAESVASNNVMDEVSFALEEGKEVIPLLLRQTSIPFRLRRVQHVDFTGDYDIALKSLIKALKPDANFQDVIEETAAHETQHEKTDSDSVDSDSSESKPFETASISDGTSGQEKAPVENDKQTPSVKEKPSTKSENEEAQPKDVASEETIVPAEKQAESSSQESEPLSENLDKEASEKESIQENDDNTFIQTPGSVVANAPATPPPSEKQDSSIDEQEPSHSQPTSKKKSFAFPAVGLALVAAVAIAYFSGIFDSGREERDAMLWDRSSSLNTTESYTEYLRTFPNGNFAAQATQRLNILKSAEADADDWEAARNLHSVEAYEEYLKKYPNGAKSIDAQDAIDDLIAISNLNKAKAEEDRIWKIAQSSSSIKDYQAYLDKYPDGVYSNDAKTIISQLNENQRRADYEAAHKRDWEAARSAETIASFEEYIRKYPNGEHVKSAQGLIQRLRAYEERSAWDSAISKNSIQGYQQYIKAYPNGRFATEAQTKITEIQNRENYVSFYKTFENNWYNEAGTWMYGIGIKDSKRYIRTGNILYFYGDQDVRRLSGGVYQVNARSSDKNRTFYLRAHSDKNLMQVSGKSNTGFTSYWKVVGRTVNRVTHSGGSFQKTSGKTWVEKDSSGTNRFYFTETRRDDWSVFLRDNQGRGELIVDVHRKMTLWTPKNGRRQDLYRLTSWHNN